MTTTELPIPWWGRLDAYLKQLQLAAIGLQQSLEDLCQNAVADSPQTLELLRLEIAQGLLDLDELISQRAELIAAADAPAQGLTLRAIVSRSSHPTQSAMIERCDTVSQSVKNCRERALASFACQFHLADYTGKLLSILTGADESTATYGQSGQKPRGSGNGGHLLNQSA